MVSSKVFFPLLRARDVRWSQAVAPKSAVLYVDVTQVDVRNSQPHALKYRALALALRRATGQRYYVSASRIQTVSASAPQVWQVLRALRGVILALDRGLMLPSFSVVLTADGWADVSPRRPYPALSWLGASSR